MSSLKFRRDILLLLDLHSLGNEAAYSDPGGRFILIQQLLVRRRLGFDLLLNEFLAE
jgi:hypothetical protein